MNNITFEISRNNDGSINITTKSTLYHALNKHFVKRSEMLAKMESIAATLNNLREPVGVDFTLNL